MISTRRRVHVQSIDNPEDGSTQPRGRTRSSNRRNNSSTSLHQGTEQTQRLNNFGNNSTTNSSHKQPHNSKKRNVITSSSDSDDETLFQPLRNRNILRSLSDYETGEGSDRTRSSPRSMTNNDQLELNINYSRQGPDFDSTSDDSVVSPRVFKGLKRPLSPTSSSDSSDSGVPIGSRRFVKRMKLFSSSESSFSGFSSDDSLRVSPARPCVSRNSGPLEVENGSNVSSGPVSRSFRERRTPLVESGSENESDLIFNGHIIRGRRIPVIDSEDEDRSTDEISRSSRNSTAMAGAQSVGSSNIRINRSTLRTYVNTRRVNAVNTRRNGVTTRRIPVIDSEDEEGSTDEISRSSRNSTAMAGAQSVGSSNIHINRSTRRTYINTRRVNAVNTSRNGVTTRRRNTVSTRQINGVSTRLRNAVAPRENGINPVVSSSEPLLSSNRQRRDPAVGANNMNSDLVGPNIWRVTNQADDDDVPISNSRTVRGRRIPVVESESDSDFSSNSSTNRMHSNAGVDDELIISLALDVIGRGAANPAVTIPNNNVSRRPGTPIIESENESNNSDSEIRPLRLSNRILPILPSDESSSTLSSSSTESDDSIPVRNPIRRNRPVPILDDYYEDNANDLVDVNIKASTSLKVHADIKTQNGNSSDSDGEIEKCPICLVGFKLQEVGKPASCDHKFCSTCIKEWATKSNTCPIDRKIFNGIVVYDKIDGNIISELPVGNVNPPQYDDLEINLLDFMFESSDDDSSWYVDDSDGEGPEEVCHACGFNTRPHRMISCDSCDSVFHLECVYPPLRDFPTTDWYCRYCEDSTDDSDSD